MELFYGNGVIFMEMDLFYGNGVIFMEMELFYGNGAIFMKIDESCHSIHNRTHHAHFSFFIGISWEFMGITIWMKWLHVPQYAKVYMNYNIILALF